jgi:hypothetical protein
LEEYGIIVAFKPLLDEPMMARKWKGSFEISCVSGMYETYIKSDLSYMNQLNFFPATSLLDDDARFNFRIVQNC